MSMKLSLAKILLPVDFSKNGLEAARYAAQLARSFRSRVTLLHVLTQHHGFNMTADDADGQFAGFLADRENEAKEQLGAFLKRGFHDLSVKRVLVKGDAAQQIVRFAHFERFDLILMPTHGYGLFRRSLLGSVTAKVLHDVNIPVLTGVHLDKGGSAKSTRLRRIVCALDLGPDSTKVLRWAAGLAARLNAVLTATHVVPGFDFPGEGYGPPDWGLLAKKKRTAAVSKLLRKCAIDAQIHLEAGSVPQALSSAAAKLRANVLVIGRAPLAADGGRLSTNGYGIIRSSPCPVVSV